jgi:RNA polymerase sigma-70 factor, ECF subfamily
MTSSAPQDDLAKRRADADRARLTEFLVATGRGDRAAFEQLYRRTSAKLFGVCFRIFGNQSEAEDVLQDVYITIWNKAATYEAGRASPITWLVTVARNRSIDRLRGVGRTGLAPLDEAAEVADPSPAADAVLIAQGDDAALSHCINGLNPRDAGFIRASFLQGATYADLAMRDGLPLGTVKSRIRRALLALRQCLGDRL